MRSMGLFTVAGLLEIGGGYLVWLWMRKGHSVGLAIAGFVALAAYGMIPTLQAKEHPFGRIYAAYGAVFIVMAALWGWWIDRRQPDVRDWMGIAICLAGATLMMWPRATAAP